MKKNKTQIVESIVEKPILIEAETLPQGVLCRVEYPICNINQLNANRRRYSGKVWECVLNKPDIKEKLEKRSLFGQGEHPAGTQSDLQLTSHVITEFIINEKDGRVYQKFDVLNTPAGRVINELLRAGCGVGVSTRAEGELKESEEDGQKIYDVIPESYDYITTDFTSNPSTANMAPKSIEMLRGKIQTEASNESLNPNEKKFVTAILESITTNIETEDASISVTDDGSVSVTKKNAIQTADQVQAVAPVTPPSVPEVPPIEEIQPEEEIKVEESKVNETKSFDIEFLVDNIGSLQSDFESRVLALCNKHKNIITSDWIEFITEMKVNDLRHLIPMIRANLGMKESAEETKETKPVSDLQKEIVELKVKEASNRAERDVAVEESRLVIASNRALKVEVNSYRKLVSNGKSIVEGLNTKIKALGDMLKGEVNKYKKLLESKENSITKLNESKSTDNDNAEELAYHKFLKEYVERKVKDSGIKLSNASLALLEECNSISDIDESFNRIVDAMRVSALHGNGAKTIEVIEDVKPVNEKEIKEKNRKIFIKESVKSLIKDF